jgi:hypothetical protein
MNEEDTRTLSDAEEKFLAALDTVPSLRSAHGTANRTGSVAARKRASFPLGSS